MAFAMRKSAQPPPPLTVAAPRHADDISSKIETAERQLAELQGQVGTAAFNAETGAPSGSERLAELNASIAGTRERLDQLRAAHRHAVELDQRAAAEARHKLLAAQLASMKAHAGARLEAMQEISDAAKSMTKAYARFFAATEKMAEACPTGLIQSPIHFFTLETTVQGSPLAVAPDVFVAAELYRHSDAAHVAAQRGLLPGARPPTDWFRMQPDKIEPAVQALERVNAWIISTVQEAVDRLEHQQP